MASMAVGLVEECHAVAPTLRVRVRCAWYFCARSVTDSVLVNITPSFMATDQHPSATTERRDLICNQEQFNQHSQSHSITVRAAPEKEEHHTTPLRYVDQLWTNCCRKHAYTLSTD
jgi:hypothetical protein